MGCSLIVLTRLAFILKGSLHFDSDQAIIGLMASDIAEGKSFPFYFWGQRYLMAVESWWVAPFFRMFGATIANLKFPLLLLNLITYLLLYNSLVRSKEASPRNSFIILMPFASASVVLSSRLVEAQGANIEPLLYVAILWFLRKRPFLLGSLSGLLFVHREFVLYPLATLLISHFLFVETEPKKNSFSYYFLVGIPFVVFVSLLRILGNHLTPFVAESRASTLSFGKPLKCFWNIITATIPTLFGFESHTFREFNIISDISPLPLTLRILSAIILVWLTVKSFQLFRRSNFSFFKKSPLSFYWLLTGAFALIAYVLVSPGDDLMTFRYQLVGLYFFLGFFAFISQTRLNRMGLAVLMCFGLINAIRSSQLAWEQAYHPPHDDYSELENALALEKANVGWGDYWVSYYLTFASQKKLLFITKNCRTPNWEKIVENSPKPRLTIQKETCSNGKKVARWYLCTVDSYGQ